MCEFKARQQYDHFRWLPVAECERHFKTGQRGYFTKIDASQSYKYQLSILIAKKLRSRFLAICMNVCTFHSELKWLAKLMAV